MSWLRFRRPGPVRFRFRSTLRTADAFVRIGRGATVLKRPPSEEAFGLTNSIPLDEVFYNRGGIDGALRHTAMLDAENIAKTNLGAECDISKYKCEIENPKYNECFMISHQAKNCAFLSILCQRSFLVYFRHSLTFGNRHYNSYS